METDDFAFCAAIGIGLGCDVCPKGAPGVGICAIKGMIESVLTCDELLLQFATKSHVDVAVIKAYHSAIIFEPGLTTMDCNTT